MGLRQILAGAADVSPARLYQMVREPWRISMALTGPRTLPDEEAVRSLFPDASRDDVQAKRLEFHRNHEFFQELNRNMVETRRRRVRLDSWKEFLYLVMRFARPRIVVETGVFDGESSAVILQALSDAGQGELISIDLPTVEVIRGSTQRMLETSLPPGLPPGWVIPSDLRARHRLELGDSREILPKVLERHPIIDVFFHDSLHTYQHQTYEYAAAWPHLPPGGLLLSDDILWSAAFHRFCREKRRPYVRVGGGVFGAVRK